MREDSNWFTRWEEELPSPEELMPLSQTLITPDLALAFDISPNPTMAPALNPQGGTTGNLRPNTPPRPPDFDCSDHSALAGASAASDEPARTLKRPRLVWTPQLHKRFVDAVAHLGIKNAVPKTIMQLMSVDGLTRENVASHLQKYRLYLKRMQCLSCSAVGASGGAATPGSILVGDAATEQLFAGNPIPHQFLGRGTSGPAQEPLMQFIAPPFLQHPQIAAAVQQQCYHQRQMGRFGSPIVGGGFEYGIHSRGAAPPGLLGMGVMHPSPASAPSNSYEDDIVSGAGGGRKILTLFPTSAEE